MGVQRRRFRDGRVQPPLELEQWELWAINRGAFSKHTYHMELRPEWIRQRHEWAAEHGWPGGEAALLAGEEPGGDEPWNQDEI